MIIFLINFACLFCSFGLGGSFVGSTTRSLDVAALKSMKADAEQQQASRFTAKDLSDKLHVYHGVKPRKSKGVLKQENPVKRSTMLNRKVASENVEKLLKDKCPCGRSCNEFFSKQDILVLRKMILGLPRQRQNAMLVDKLKKYGTVASGSDGRLQFKFQYRLEGATAGGCREVCSTFWWSAVGISKTRFHKLQRSILNNTSPETVKYRRARLPNTRTLKARWWMKDYVVDHGQAIPNKEEFHLQRGVSKADVWMEYKRAMNNLGEPTTLKYPHFINLWNNEFKHVKVMPSTDFARCDLCERCQEQLSSDLPMEITKDLQLVYATHLRNQCEARQLFYRHNYKAKKNPEKYLSLINDGMTQNTTRLPKFKRKAKAWEKQKDAASGPHLATHAMGTLCPGVPLAHQQFLVGSKRSKLLCKMAHELKR